MALTKNLKRTGAAAHRTIDDVRDDEYAAKLKEANDKLEKLIGLAGVIEIYKTAKPGTVLEALLESIAINEADRKLPHRPNEFTAHEEEVLAHVDSLIGSERLTVMQMIDASELPFEMDGTYPSPYISGGEVYDFTPCEGMPVIDFDKIEEVKF